MNKKLNNIFYKSHSPASIKYWEDKINVIRDEWDYCLDKRAELLINQLPLEGKFIKYINGSDTPIYMYVYDQFISNDKNGPFINYNMYITGAAFSYFECNYLDGSWIDFSSDKQIRCNMRDILYMLEHPDNTTLKITVIDRDEFISKYNEMINKSCNIIDNVVKIIDEKLK